MVKAERLVVELNGAPVSFRDFAAYHVWQGQELEAWTFLSQIADPWSAFHLISSRLNEVTSRARELEIQGSLVTDLAGPLEEAFRDSRNDAAIYSDSALGRRILRIRETRGDAAAAFAFAFAKQRTNLPQARSPEDLGAAMLLAMPDLLKPEEIAHRQKLERENDRRNIANLMQRLEEALVARDEEWTALQERQRKRFYRWAVRGARRVSSDSSKLMASMSQAKEEIDNTHATYTERMRLKAAVDYWTRQATAHGEKEGPARTRVILFFSLLVPFMILMFVVAGFFLLAEVKVAPQMYVVVGAGLATITGTLFWVGRLLTRLYLSEHHLRHDAEEWAVMTQTYLALMNEGAASDADRQIILAALFRSTPDGIVKDDGPPDASLAALVARVAGGKVS